MTDGFRYDTLQVLNAGEVYVCGPPMTLGAITQRTELQSTAIDRYNHGEPRRGWFMQAIEGMTVGNGRAVTKATRL